MPSQRWCFSINYGAFASRGASQLILFEWLVYDSSSKKGQSENEKFLFVFLALNSMLSQIRPALVLVLVTQSLFNSVEFVFGIRKNDYFNFKWGSKHKSQIKAEAFTIQRRAKSTKGSIKCRISSNSFCVLCLVQLMHYSVCTFNFLFDWNCWKSIDGHEWGRIKCNTKKFMFQKMSWKVGEQLSRYYVHNNNKMNETCAATFIFLRLTIQHIYNVRRMMKGVIHFDWRKLQMDYQLCTVLQLPSWLRTSNENLTSRIITSQVKVLCTTFSAICVDECPFTHCMWSKIVFM